MTSDQFWHLIDLCRSHANDMPSFNTVLSNNLANLPPEELWSFHKCVWHYVQHLQFKGGFNEELNDCLDRHMDLRIGGDTGDCYVGWVIAQGKEWYDTIDQDPRRASERLPTWKDVWEGEHVIFMAMRVFRDTTGQDLLDVIEDDESV